MKRKVFFLVAVLALTVFSVAFSYSRYGKKVSENTSMSPDGRILVCRKFSEISKVLVIDLQKKSRKREVFNWNYNSEAGDMTLDEDLSDFVSPAFHIEGKPSEPPQFVLWGYDAEKGPAGVFLNEKVAAQNRDYTIEEFDKDGENEKKRGVLTMHIPSKELASVVVIWHTAEGLSSISEMTEKQADLYAELQGAWLTENAKKEIAKRTEEAILEFDGDEPRVVMKKIGDEERRKMLDEFPVCAYKYRRNASAAKLSGEAGFAIRLPQKSGDYKLVSAMLIETALRGEKSKSVEFDYDKGDAFSAGSIGVEVSKFGEEKIPRAEHLILQETLGLRLPVAKQVCWSVVSEGALGGELDYRAEKFCVYWWREGETLYQVRCAEERAREVEEFIKGLL